MPVFGFVSSVECAGGGAARQSVSIPRHQRIPNRAKPAKRNDVQQATEQPQPAIWLNSEKLSKS